MPRLRVLCALFPALFAALTAPAIARQPAPAAYPEDHVAVRDVEAALRFLAADELMGRKAGTTGNDVAARYIAEQFRRAGLRHVPGADDYFQRIPFVRTAPPQTGTLTLLRTLYHQGGDLLFLAGDSARALDAPVVYAGFGARDADYRGLDAAGKIVVTKTGTPNDVGVQAAYRALPHKRALAARHGAVALLELYRSPFPWRNLVSLLGVPRFGLDTVDTAAADLPTAWVPDGKDALIEQLQVARDATASLKVSGMRREPAASSNVLGWIEGTDPALRDEYVVLTAHYDHVGAGLQNGPGATPADSIFNGARDNGIGTVALMTAADALSRRPPRRSVLFLALTAEEDGLLGSRYFTEHALVPLHRMVFNLNIDGGGFSDTTIVTVIGLERTSAEPLIRKGTARYGLTPIPDPAPDQNLFDRSDNVNFARRGIPAPTFSPGFRSFEDAGIAAYYHRPQDEADDEFDYAYLRRFAQAYAHVARLIADAEERPTWRSGDPYEEAARALYGAE